MGNISNTNVEADICVEMHHGRKGKNMGTKFKGVVRGVLISTLITASLLTTTVPALAATEAGVVAEAQGIVSVYGVTFEEAVSVVRNNIHRILDMKNSGTLTQRALDELAVSISQLERTVDKTDFSQISTVSHVLDSAESVVQGVEGNTGILAVISVARQSLGIEKAELNVNQATAPSDIKSFSDVSESHWAYKTVMRAVELGLFEGTTAPVNGVGTFTPDKTMTRAEFITVCVRATGYPASSYQNPNGSKWYDGYWDQAAKLGLISRSAFGGIENLGQPMSREEMAYVAAKTLSYLGESPETLLDWDRIPDMSSVSSQYQNYVLIAYSMGILCGVDEIGTYNPSGTLNRAQAATVCVRLLDKSYRQSVSNEKPASTVSATWVEGEKHDKPKAGDVVINSKGEKITLTETKIGNYTILGVGQPVDIWTGYASYHVGGASGWGEFNAGDSSRLCKSSVTGEVHTEEEFQLIEGLYSPPNRPGAYEGEIANTYYRWTVRVLSDMDASLAGTDKIEFWKPCFGDITE